MQDQWVSIIDGGRPLEKGADTSISVRLGICSRIQTDMQALKARSLPGTEWGLRGFVVRDRQGLWALLLIVHRGVSGLGE